MNSLAKWVWLFILALIGLGPWLFVIIAIMLVVFIIKWAYEEWRYFHE